MKSRIFPLIAGLLSGVPAVAAGRNHTAGTEWTFYSGSSTGCSADHDTHCSGAYGTVGVPAASNLPGARCCAHTWQKDGVFYLFGGYGYDEEGNLGYLSDVWTFDAKTSQWTWLAGPKTCNHDNTDKWPATRHYAAYGFDDSTNSLLIFSGLGGSNPDGDWLTDLWKIQVTSKNGGSTEVTATLLEDHAAPLGRYWTSYWYSDNQLWVLGGITVNKTSLNDLWVYDAHATNDGDEGKWTRIYDRADDIVGVYSGEHQYPGQRENAFTSVDKNTKTLWMFGGSGYGATSDDRGDLSDMWSFDPESQKWQFRGGAAGTVGDPGLCGEAGEFGDFLPEARHAGYNVETVSSRGRMYVIMGEHLGESEVYGDVWALNVSAATEKQAGKNSFPSAVFTEHCNVCNTNASYSGPTPVPGSRFAGNAWVIEGQSTQGTRHEQATHADHVYVYGGWGVDESQQQVYLSDMWVALA